MNKAGKPRPRHYNARFVMMDGVKQTFTLKGKSIKLADGREFPVLSKEYRQCMVFFKS